MTAMIILHSDTYGMLLDELMRAAYDAMALNSTGPFEMALAEAACIFPPAALGSGSPWPTASDEAWKNSATPLQSDIGSSR
jgi:hypothetical protein